MENKKRILVVYHSMIMGGSTTSLLGLLKNLDNSKYEVHLQLFQNTGAMFREIPEYVHVLPQAQNFSGTVGKLIKGIKFVLSGYCFRALNKKLKDGTANTTIIEFQAKYLSRINQKHYDYAISFLEGWSSQYLAYQIHANKKYAWIHSTFSKTKDSCDSKLRWVDFVDKIVFVADDCKADFCRCMPNCADKAVTIKNIVDSGIVRARALQVDENDEAFCAFRDANCFKLITVCRIEIATKGLDRVILCARNLKQKGKQFLWYIVGDGIELEKFQDMIANADLNDCVRAVGSRMNPLPFVREADVFCMLSRYEGKPMVITESMIVGVPPLVTRYFSAAEQIEAGVEGIIVENEDDSAIPQLIMSMENPKTIEAMKAVLRDREYGNSSYIHEIESTYFN